MGPEDFLCPCGRAWPCACKQARKLLGLPNPPLHPEDDHVIALARCPSCGEDALIEIDPEDVVEWESETRIVREIGPAMGTCCEYLFAMQPDGHVFALKEREDRP